MTTTTVHDTDGTPWHAGDVPQRRDGEHFDAYTDRLLRAVRAAIVAASDSYNGAMSTRLVASEHDAHVVVRVESDDYETWHAYVEAVRQ